MKKSKAPYTGPERRDSTWHRAATLRDVIIFELVGVVLTIVLIFTIVGLTSQGQKELAERVDRNSARSVEETAAILCVLATVPENRSPSHFSRCVEHHLGENYLEEHFIEVEGGEL